MTEHEEMVAAAEERLCALLQDARDQVDAVIQRAEDEADRLIREVKAATGVEICTPPPPSHKVPGVLDVRLGDLAEIAALCGYLLAGAELLGSHVQVGSERTVGAVLKTAVDVPTGAAVVHLLSSSKFFAPDEG